MNKYIVSNPSSRQVSVGRDEQGNRSATVTHRGSGSMNSTDTYRQAMGNASANIEPMQREAQRHADRINARKSVVNPRTGVPEYLYSEEERKNSMLKLQQLNESIAYQRQQAHVQATEAQSAADAKRAITAAEYETSSALDQRANEIAFENAAKAQASRLSGGK